MIVMNLAAFGISYTNGGAGDFNEE